MYAKFKNLEESRFIDGSEYKGTWSMFGMEGVGKFTMPHSQYILLSIREMLQNNLECVFLYTLLVRKKKKEKKAVLKVENNYNKKQEISEM